MKKRRISLVLAATVAITVTAGCAEEREAHIVASAHQCGLVLLSPDIAMRLTRYTGWPDSVTRYIVQACYPVETACTPILKYSAAPEPLYALGEDGTIRIALDGGRLETQYNEQITVGGAARAIVVTYIDGGPDHRRRLLQERGPWRGAPNSRC